MRKFPLFSRGTGEDAQSGPEGPNKRWKQYLATALALLVVAVIVTTCGLGGSSRAPLAKNSAPTAGLSATPTSDTTAALLATPGAGSTATAQPGVQPTTQSGVQPTAGPGVQPTTQPGVQPTAGPGGQPTPPPTDQPTPTPTAQPVPTPTPTAQPVPTPTPPISLSSVTVWIQVTDSCRQALPGGTFFVSGPGVSTTTAPTGGIYGTVGGGGCPIPHGTCASGNGCTTAVLPVPTSGSLTYTITIYGTATGGHGRNVKYAVCNGGSDCPHGPQRATVQVNADGSISATTLNIYPDGASITYGPFPASQGDPIMFHEFGVAGDTSVQCDKDSDADDYLTGTPSSHCDSDKGQPGS